MISTVNVSLQYGGRELFKSVSINFTKGIVIIFIALAAVAAVNLLLRIWHRHCGMSVWWAIVPAAVIVLGMTIFFLRCGFGFLFEDWSQTVWL